MSTTIPSLRDVDQRVLGAVAGVLLLAMVAGVFAVGTAGLFEDRYVLRAVFAGTGGLEAAADVRVAGVSVGEVTDIVGDFDRGHVVVTFEVDDGVALGPDTTAEIAAATLLGGYYLRLDGPVAEPTLESLPDDDPRRTIPNERTVEPTSLNRVLDETTETITAIDFGSANAVLGQVAGAADRNVDVLPALIEDFTTVATAIASRDAELRRLIESGERLTGALASRDAELASLIEASDRLLVQLVERRDQLTSILLQGGAAADRASALLSSQRDAIDQLLDDVEAIAGELAGTLPSLNRALTQSQVLFPLLSQTLDPAGGFSVRGEGIIVHPGQVENIVDTVEDLLGILGAAR